MKPTAEMHMVADALARKHQSLSLGRNDLAREFAQALADEHERAMGDIREAEIRGATWALETMLHALPLTTPAEMQDRCIRIVAAKRGEGR